MKSGCRLRKMAYLYSSVPSFNSSCTALPSDAYSFFVLSFNRAFVASSPAMPVRNSTRSFSNSTRSDMVVSGSYLNKIHEMSAPN